MKKLIDMTEAELKEVCKMKNTKMKHTAETITEYLNENLLGSGFDYDFGHIKTLKNGKEVLETYYHNIHDNGYYDTLTKLRLVIDLNDLLAYRLTCLGGTKYIGLNRDYWNEMIYQTLETIDNK